MEEKTKERNFLFFFFELLFFLLKRESVLLSLESAEKKERPSLFERPAKSNHYT